MQSYTDIDSYTAQFPEETQALLEQMRTTISKAAPEATEAISYGIPTFKLEGNLVHYAGYKNHIGFYPGSGAILDFADELTGLQLSKGTIQFPITAPLPLELVAKITRARVEQNLAKARAKKKK